MNTATCLGQWTKDGRTMKICHHSDGAVTLGIKLFKRLCVKFLFHKEGSYVKSQRSKSGTFNLEFIKFLFLLRT